MVTIEEAAGVLGLTPRQVYRRVSAVRPLLGEYLRRGQNGALLLDGSAVEILRRAEGLRKDGYTVAQAVAQIADELGGDGAGEPGRAIGEPAENSPWLLLMEEKDKRIQALEEEVRWLRGRLEELERRALPPAGSRRWPWTRLFKGKS